MQHVEGRWQLPGGAVDPGERPAAAMQRECREEAGIDVEHCIAGVFGGPDYRITYSNGDQAGWVVTVFEALITIGEPSASDDETQAVGWFSPEQIDALELAPSTRETLRYLAAGKDLSERDRGRSQPLRVVRGGKVVLDNLNCSVASGSVTGLLGPSGSGKCGR